MKYALQDDQRIEASAGLRAKCPDCGAVVVAKCGTFRVHHWAHYGVRDCDTWAENETEWHRAWKNKFPVEWQEIAKFDESRELHRADVRTDLGLTIEFQHSHIKPEERIAREKFYGDMIWVVDGTRKKYDFPRFRKASDMFRKIADNRYRVDFPDEVFPKDWIESTVPVLFDFMGQNPPENPHSLRKSLWCLLPGRSNHDAYLISIPRNDLVETVNATLRPFVAPEGVKLTIEKKREEVEEVRPYRNIDPLQALLQLQRAQRGFRRGFRRF